MTKISVAQRAVLEKAVATAFNRAIFVESDEVPEVGEDGAEITRTNWLINWSACGAVTTASAETFAEWIRTACKVADMLNAYDVSVDYVMQYTLDGVNRASQEEVNSLAEEVSELISRGYTSKAVHSVLAGKVVVF